LGHGENQRAGGDYGGVASGEYRLMNFGNDHFLKIAGQVGERLGGHNSLNHGYGTVSSEYYGTATAADQVHVESGNAHDLMKVICNY
jgi:hypothetical protein